MRKLFPLSLMCWVAAGQSLITLDIGPQAAQWNGSGAASGTYRLEFRLENVQPASKVLSNGSGVGNLNCGIDAKVALACSQGGDGAPNGLPASALTAGQDVRARFQRDAGGLTYTLETWSGDCSHHFQRQFRVTNGGAMAPGATWVLGPWVNNAFLRGYSTLDTAGDCPVDAPLAVANLFDFTFEGNSLTDRSGHGYRMQVPGLTNAARQGLQACTRAPCFAPSTAYAPQPAISGWTGSKPVFVAGMPFQLSGASSFSSGYPGTGTPASYQWVQTAGPAQSTISGDQTATPSITAPAAGEYTFQLTVTDAGGSFGPLNLRAVANTGASSQAVGVVALSSANGVVQPDPDFTWALGTVAAYGNSGWPWYDATAAADADLLSPLMIAPPASTAGPGTLYAPAGTGAPNFLDGQGLLTSQQYGGVLWVGTGTDFTPADVGNRIVLFWDADGNGTNQGRRTVYINQVIDATHIVGSDYNLQEPASVFDNPQGLSWGRLGADFAPYNSSDVNNFILNYYEAGLGVGRLYAATGLSAYQKQFHAFCDNWWRWGLESGYAVPIPRNSGLHMMVACAADPTYNAPPQMWDGIARITQNMSGYFGTAAGVQRGFNPTAAVAPGTSDVRETSYFLRPTALLARLYGKHGGDTSTWCGYLANQVTNFWIADAELPANAPSTNYAYWEENLFLMNINYVAASIPAGDPNGHFGTSPWRSAGLPTLALIYAHDALNDPAACNKPSLANLLWNPADGSGVIASSANYIWDYGRSADGGVFYAEGYATDTGNTLGATVFNAAPQNGSISVTAGSTAVTGNGSYFTAQFGPCDGSTQIAIQSATYGVAGCADDTHLTLASPYAGATQNGTGPYSNPATIAVTNGSTLVTGSGTKFGVLFAPCDGTTFIGIVGNQNPGGDRRVYQVTSCADDQHLTINLGYAGPTESGLNVFSRARRVNQNCGPLSISTHCEADRYNGRNLSSDIAASSAWLYAQTGLASWKARAQYYANKTFGGAAGGSGAIGPPTGSCTYARSGTIAVTGGTTRVTGSGTQFTQQFACDGTDRITIADATGGSTWAGVPAFEPTFYTLNVQSCTSDTALTLTTPYPGVGGSNISMFYRPDDPQWQCADGGANNLGEILPTCQTSAPPCGIGDMVPKYGKPLGMAAGAGDVPLMFADLFAPPATALDVPINLPSVPEAAKAHVTVSARGVVIGEAVCSLSPCRIRARGNLGGATLAIEYVSATGVVLSTEKSDMPKTGHAPDNDSHSPITNHVK